MSPIHIYEKPSDEETIRCINDLRPRIKFWFSKNPKRILCKVDLGQGKTINVRRNTYKKRLDLEIEKLTKYP